MAAELDSLVISQLRAYALGQASLPLDSNATTHATAPNSSKPKEHISQLKSDLWEGLRYKRRRRNFDDARTASWPWTHQISQDTSEQDSYPIVLNFSASQPDIHERSRTPTEHLNSDKSRGLLSLPQPPSIVPESSRARMSGPSQGDTQPFSQSVYDNLAKRAQAATRLPKSGSKAEYPYGSTPCTYSQDRTGHVDLIGAFEQDTFSDRENGHDSDQEDDAEGASQIDVRVEPFPESKRFQAPKTPATNGKKRNRSGELIQDTTINPILPTNPFVNQAARPHGLMDLSQAFRATQAQSSPMTGILLSDALSDRPSPEFLNMQRPQSVNPQSSPVRPERVDFQRAVIEPQAVYVSMKESQELRDRMKAIEQIARLKEQGPPRDLLDDEFESDPSQLRRRLNQQRIDIKTRNEFINITAPSRPASSMPGRERGTQHLPSRSSPKSMLKGGRNPVVISDDIDADNAEDNASEVETEREGVEEETVDLTPLPERTEENKENIDLDVQVPMTSSRANFRATSQGRSQISPLSKRQRHASHASDDYSRSRDTEDLNTHGSVSTEINDTVASAPQLVNIADSQTSQSCTKLPNTLQSTGPSAPAFSESRSIVPQSQAFLLPNLRHSQLPTSTSVGNVESSPLSPQPPTSSHPGDDNSSHPPPGLVISSPSHATTSLISRKNRPNSRVNSKYQGCETDRNYSITATFHARTDTALNSSPPQRNPDNQAVRPQNVSPGLYHSPLVENKEPTATAERRETAEISRQQLMAEDYGAIGRNNDINEPPITRDRLIESSMIRSIVPMTSSASHHTDLSVLHVKGSATVSQTVYNPRSSAELPRNPSLHQDPSKSSNLFETAPTHLPDSTPRTRDSRKRSEPGKSPNSQQVRRSRTLTEIARDPVPSDAVGDIDLDVGLISKEDEQFQAAMEGSSPIGPARKRRRGHIGQVLQAVDAESMNPTSKPLFDTQAREIDGGEAAAEARQMAMGQITFRSSTIPEALRAPIRHFSRPGREPLSRESGMSEALPSVAVGPISSHPAETRDDFRSMEMLNVCETEKTEPSRGDETTAQGEIIAPNRVFAYFNGQSPAYWPATCLAMTRGDESRFKVRFDDGTVDTIGGYAIKRLDLQLGDTVKLNLTGSRTKNYVVVGFKHKRQHPPDPETPSRDRHAGPLDTTTYPQTDARGYSHIVVAVRQRNGQAVAETFTVKLTDVYLTQTMWPNLKGRQYSFVPDKPLLPTLGLQTPLEKPSTPSTPSPRTRRIKASIPRYIVGSVTSGPLPRTYLGIFENVAFAISGIASDERRGRAISQILSNGGHLLKEGFHELFHIPNLEPTSPLKRKSPILKNDSFALIPRAEQLGFTCLLADKHSRTAKYIQALALGVPCLATRWVEDCIKQERLLPWEAYLLPSGESAFLDGAVRSRLLPSINPETARLALLVENRPQWIADRSVLLVMSEEKRKSYLFLTYALGAKKVAKTPNLHSAKILLSDTRKTGQNWDWICVEKDEPGAVEKFLFGSEAGKKRKKGGKGAGVLNDRANGRPRVVDDEFVVQSLILGRLVEA